MNKNLLNVVIVVIVFLLFVVIIALPYLIQLSFDIQGVPLHALNASDILNYIGAIATFIGTTVLGIIAVVQNKRYNNENREFLHIQQDHYNMQHRPFLNLMAFNLLIGEQLRHSEHASNDNRFFYTSNELDCFTEKTNPCKIIMAFDNLTNVTSFTKLLSAEISCKNRIGKFVQEFGVPINNTTITITPKQTLIIDITTTDTLINQLSGEKLTLHFSLKNGLGREYREKVVIDLVNINVTIEDAGWFEHSDPMYSIYRVLTVQSSETLIEENL